jgi:hypothetical protein
LNWSLDRLAYEEVGLQEDERALRTYLEDAGIVISAVGRPLLSIDEILEKLEIYRDLVLGYLSEHSSDYNASLVCDYVLSHVNITIDGLRHYTVLRVTCSTFDFDNQPNTGDEDRCCVDHGVISDLSNSEAPATAGDQSLSERLDVVTQSILVNQPNHTPDKDGLEMHDVDGTGECRDARTGTPVATYSQPASLFEQTDLEYVVPDIFFIAPFHPLRSRNMDMLSSNQEGQLHQKQSSIRSAI